MKMSLFLAIVVAMSAAVSVVSGAEPKQEKAQSSAKFQQGVTVGGHFIAVDNRGHLTSNDLQWGTTRDFGKLDRELAPSIDVAGDKAVVTTATEVCEVSLVSGTVLRAAQHGIGAGGVGFIDADRVFVHNGQSLEIVDLAANMTLHKIDQAKGKKNQAHWFHGRPLIAHARKGNLLFVARPYRGEVVVVDLDRGEQVKEIEITGFGWATGLHIAGDKLFTRQMSVSYGFIRERLSVIDLATGKGKELQFPKSPGSEPVNVFESQSAPRPLEMVACDDGGFFLASGEGVFRYNAAGQLVGEAPQALKNGARLVAAEEGIAMVSGATMIGKIKMSTVKIVAN